MPKNQSSKIEKCHTGRGGGKGVRKMPKKVSGIICMAPKYFFSCRKDSLLYPPLLYANTSQKKEILDELRRELELNSKLKLFILKKYLLYFQFSHKIPLEIWTCYVLFWTGKSKKKLKEFTG